MKQVERPAPVLVAALNHGFDGVTNAAVRFDSCISQIIESAQHIVVPKRWKREAEPAFVDYFVSSKRAGHAALEQIVFSLPAGLRDGRRFASSLFIYEQSFQHADGGMERRAPAFGCVAIPAAIFQLLLQELTGQRVVWFFEIRADREDSAVDARLCFAVKERPVVKPFKHEPIVDAVDHFASVLAGGVETEIHQSHETVEGYKQISVLFRQVVPLSAGALSPVARRRLAREKLGSPAFSCDARPFGCNCVGGFTGEVSQDLPTDGRVRIEQPFEVRGPGCVILEAHWHVIANGGFVFSRALTKCALAPAWQKWR
jgi:hypothetical protein